ncbi:MAG TPA: hypothetical protein ENN21_00270, partial [Spirochaetes bacterium]|nr:hypothetical protein [Spirochaetota bacterium]
MFEKIAILDTGTSSIKLMLVKTGFRNFEVVSLLYEDVDMNREDRTEAMAEAIGRILAETDIRDHTLLANLPMEQTLIRNIVFPFSDVRKIAEA